MRYELRIDGKLVGTWDRGEQAEARARQAMRGHPDCEPEILDTVTGRPYAPGATQNDRNDLENKVGF